MPPVNEPKTLFALARETISELIITKCIAIEDGYNASRTRNLTYNNPACAAAILILHDALFDYVPPRMYNFICAAVQSTHRKRKRKIRNLRILYGVLVNENLTSLKVGGRMDYGVDLCRIPNCIPSLKNIVKLNLRYVKSDVLNAVINACEKLEDISLPGSGRSLEAICSLANKCPKLRIISQVYGFDGSLPNETAKIVMQSLPNLEYFDYYCLAEVLKSAQLAGPLKLRRVNEHRATPSNVSAALALCPDLRCIQLTPRDMKYSKRILDILTKSPLEIKQVHLLRFDLAIPSAERFFVDKGQHVTELSIRDCHVPDLINFINLIGKYCKNLEKLSFTVQPSDSDFMYNVSETSSFDNVKILAVYRQNYYDLIDNDDRMKVEMVTALIANSPSLQVFSLQLSQFAMSDDEIEQVFSVERIKKLRLLHFSDLEVTERIVHYFRNNAPSMTEFSVDYELTPDMVTVVNQVNTQAAANNVNFKFKYNDLNVYDVGSDSDGSPVGSEDEEN